jgi:uncharacterized protein YecT (DUF1311 family)
MLVKQQDESKPMKTKQYLISLTVFLTANISLAQTQAEMNKEAYSAYEKADKKLNVVYKQLINGLDQKEKQMLIQVQKDWIKFRDSYCEFEAEENEGGSMQPMVEAMCLEEITNIRIKQLEQSIKSRGITHSR